MDTIAAIATPSGPGAVSMVRISGRDAKDIFKKVWISNQHPVEKFATHQLYYGKIGDVSVGRGPIDNVLAVWMNTPHSYTGEDAVEIFCHGGGQSSKLVLEAVLNAGARMAEPGEFTKRAFLNGKLDLIQAEAVAGVIGAASERAYRLASEQLNGRLSKEIETMQAGLKNLKAFVEASIDFPEEDVEFIDNGKIGEQAGMIVKNLNRLLSTYDEGRTIQEGVSIAIVGKPNVGKSSLFNVLLGNERAIVHKTPGTTRDTIEEAITIGGVLFRLVDTAGIHNSNCEIEKMGISRSKTRIGEADLMLVVLDASVPLSHEDEVVLNETDDAKRIIILNKIDIGSSFCMETGIKTSTKTGEGLEALRIAMLRFAGSNESVGSEGAIITNLRHKKLLEDAVAFLLSAGHATKQGESAEFVSFHLQEAINSLGRITGSITTEEVLNEIFSKFCIGK